MEAVLDLERYPLDELQSPAGQALIRDCRQTLAESGMFNLEGFVQPLALEQCIVDVKTPLQSAAFTHKRLHNIYFKSKIDDLPTDHPVLQQFETINHTICADQITDSIVCQIYHWQPFIEFLSQVVGERMLYAMADPLASVNVMAYRHGETLNWHFDRSEFTTTLLLQAPEHGGVFQYRDNLRSEDGPNYEGVATLLNGEDAQVKNLSLQPGTLNVFRGRNTAHRVTSVVGEKQRIVAVYSYYDKPGVSFSAEEQLGFYGRTLSPAIPA